VWESGFEISENSLGDHRCFLGMECITLTLVKGGGRKRYIRGEKKKQIVCSRRKVQETDAAY